MGMKVNKLKMSTKSSGTFSGCKGLAKKLSKTALDSGPSKPFPGANRNAKLRKNTQAMAKGGLICKSVKIDVCSELGS